MDSDRLNAFIVLAEELNFRRSAEILGMSQPPLSRLIANLEHELGVSLFERSTRKVSLTGAGVVLLKEARNIIASFERLKIDVSKAAMIKQGSLKIGFSATAFLARFPVIIEEFQNLYPKIRLDLHQGNQKEIVSGVATSRFDVGFVEGVTARKDLECMPVSEEVLGALLKKNHRLAKRKEIEFSELSEETLILHHKREAEEFFKTISKLIQGLEKPPKVYIKSQQESCPILVATGKGVSLTIEGAQKVASEGTKFVPIKGMFLPVSLYWKQDNANSLLKTFLGAVEENRSLRHSPTHCLSLG